MHSSGCRATSGVVSGLSYAMLWCQSGPAECQSGPCSMTHTAGQQCVHASCADTVSHVAVRSAVLLAVLDGSRCHHMHGC